MIHESPAVSEIVEIMVPSAAVIWIHPEKLRKKLQLKNLRQKKIQKKARSKFWRLWPKRGYRQRSWCFALLNQKQLLDVDRKREPFMGIRMWQSDYNLFRNILFRVFLNPRLNTIDPRPKGKFLSWLSGDYKSFTENCQSFFHRRKKIVTNADFSDCFVTHNEIKSLVRYENFSASIPNK